MTPMRLPQRFSHNSAPSSLTLSRELFLLLFCFVYNKELLKVGITFFGDEILRSVQTQALKAVTQFMKVMEKFVKEVLGCLLLLPFSLV